MGQNHIAGVERIHLRAGRPDLALEALKDCWRKQNLTEDPIAASRYPDHSGDILCYHQYTTLEANTYLLLNSPPNLPRFARVTSATKASEDVKPRPKE